MDVDRLRHRAQAPLRDAQATLEGDYGLLAPQGERGAPQGAPPSGPRSLSPRARAARRLLSSTPPSRSWALTRSVPRLGAAQKREAQLEIKRRAARVAREVKSFWTKIDRVVAYKQRLEVDEQRRKTMDKHLVFLVRQTEGYSSALAATYQTSCETEREPLAKTSPQL